MSTVTYRPSTPWPTEASYFYGLHGNLVKSGQMERVLEAAEDGLIVLPEHDYQVLRRWHAVPYGI